VTAGLDVQTATNDMFAYEDLVDTGEIIGLRAFPPVRESSPTTISNP